LCARRDTDLIACAVASNSRANRMRAVTRIVARRRRVSSAVAASRRRMNAVVPVEIVIERASIEPAVVADQRLVIKPLAGVASAYDDPLPGEAQTPDFGRADIAQSAFNAHQSRASRLLIDRNFGLVYDDRVCFDPRYIVATREVHGYFGPCIHE